jgi:predicted PhzF superfamily epimerase YddE/YHI9
MPTVEMDLCGHATLASARVIFHHLGRKKETISLQSPVANCARGRFCSAVASYSVKTEENALESVGTR